MIKQTGLTRKRINITTSITLQDHAYAKANALMFSRLLENAISIHRTAQEQGIQENYYNYLKNKLSIISNRLEKANEFMEKKGIIDEFMDEVNK